MSNVRRKCLIVSLMVLCRVPLPVAVSTRPIPIEPRSTLRVTRSPERLLQFLNEITRECLAPFFGRHQLGDLSVLVAHRCRPVAELQTDARTTPVALDRVRPEILEDGPDLDIDEPT